MPFGFLFFPPVIVSKTFLQDVACSHCVPRTHTGDDSKVWMSTHPDGPVGGYLGLLGIELRLIQSYRLGCEHVSSFLPDEWRGVQLRVCIGIACLILEEAVSCFPE